MLLTGVSALATVCHGAADSERVPTGTVRLRAEPSEQQLAEAYRPRVVVRHAADDAITVSFDRKNLVFDPDESLRVMVTLNLPEIRDARDKPLKVHLKWKLSPAGSKRPVADGSASMVALVNAANPVQAPVEFRLPRNEGVYNLRLAASGHGFEDVARVVQLVVVAANRSDRSAAASLEGLADSFDSPTGRVTIRRRLVGPYLHKPQLIRSLGADQLVESADKHNPDGWQTYMAAGKRLVDHLQDHQQSAMLLAVFADGESIYPSELLESPLRRDNGRSASNGQDPIQKDVLELFLRLFDREGLVLIPELQFDAPLPAIERLIRERSESSDELALVNGEGRLRPGESHSAPPYYNVLAPGVQEAVIDVVQELLRRYASHAAFGGVAFELGPNSFLRLPGIEWGYDAATIRRFEAASLVHVPREGENGGPESAYRFLTTTARREWLRFRCAEVARFHRRLVELVTAARPDARVIFSGRLALPGDSDSEATLIEFARSGGNPLVILPAQGLDFSQAPYANIPAVTVLRPLVRSGSADKIAQAAMYTINNSPAIDALYRSGRTGTLVSSPSEKTRADESSSDPRLPSRSATDEKAAARQDVHALATLDAQVIFDGASGIQATPDERIQQSKASIAKLPDMPFRNTGVQVQPVVVRCAHVGNVTYLYAVNDSSLGIDVELLLNCPATTTCRRLHPARSVSLHHPDGNSETAQAGNHSEAGALLKFELPGHELACFRLERANIEAVETRLAVSENALDEVRSRIDDFSAKMSVAAGLAKAGAYAPPDEGTVVEAQALTSDEVRQLTKTLSSVKLAWKDGRYADCQRLLDGYWGQLLLSEPAARPAESPARPRLSDRMKGIFRRQR